MEEPMKPAPETHIRPRGLWLIAAVLATLVLASCGSDHLTGPGTTMPPGLLVVRDSLLGYGATAHAGDDIAVQYKLWLSDGTLVDNSYARGQAFTFRLGAGVVIRGWDLGIPGMRVGGVRRLVIPPALAYGATGAGGVIPPNATLISVVELIAVRRP
jgi:FKBP-type peptidyl-prolyl cis-trans isomerase FkpA